MIIIIFNFVIWIGVDPDMTYVIHTRHKNYLIGLDIYRRHGIQVAYIYIYKL